MKYVKDDQREQRRLEKMLRGLAKNPHVAVGILQDHKVDNNFSMVDLATVHEYGSQYGRIPARSFIRSTCDAMRTKHLNLMSTLQNKILGGKLLLSQALETLGEVISKDMVSTINQGVRPDLTDGTIKRKKSSKPLIDTGRLKGAITHEVRQGTNDEL
jgi:phage gpG-like protein